MDAVLIAGPTASGKSSLALQLAAELDGVIVNTDSMQVYDTLRVLTARPSDDDLRAAPHRLYGHVPASESYSVGAWSRDVGRLLAEEEGRRRTAIFVGGTGLYFKALTGGLSEMPDIPDEIRQRWRERLAAEGSQPLHRELALRDPDIAARLKPGDSQRIVRALEVHEASGKSIRHFQETKGKSLLEGPVLRRIVLAPDRAPLRQRIRARFEAMMDAGAVEEAQALLAMNLPPDLPSMRAIGVREIAAWLGGDLTRDEAVERAVIATAQYAKRQMTWFRNQFGDDWEWKPV
ncbi:tRNA (adenosine(37)-N6)-dimethylallyltransferase MiaA [Hoeflea sp. WL0058]|uniref:tRNA dimethylallyltransferase n=1 Tax=Flavimaribacter sediminis TaxID=2865987 RepID=A0AAE2ZGL1_9HYPH|nr:tRNA (adenosine(37)-N6)-dimethylallyltransferase MiaA [Flavimaribacter sediminis]MBW8635816.1 tRNA (adenosine(37)-N6)-dimethylallyltransferase MiaA [Flavimaribacter sediminis]